MATSWAESIPSRSNAWPCSLAGFAIGGKTWSALPGSDVAIFEEQAVEAVVPAINGLPRSLAQLMFEDDDRDGAEAQRNLPVEPARVSESARAMADAKCTLDGLPSATSQPFSPTWPRRRQTRRQFRPHPTMAFAADRRSSTLDRLAINLAKFPT